MFVEFTEETYRSLLKDEISNATGGFIPDISLERALGFDMAIFCDPHTLARMAANNAQGIFLRRTAHARNQLTPNQRNQLLNFRHNVFIQAKRPRYYRSRSNRYRTHFNFTDPLYYYFYKTTHQQESLDNLANSLGNRAHISYAAPVFRSTRELERYARAGTIVDHSTFPQVDILSGDDHKRWIYQQPGIVGVANTKIKHINRPDLSETISEFRSSRQYKKHVIEYDQMSYSQNTSLILDYYQNVKRNLKFTADKILESESEYPSRLRKEFKNIEQTIQDDAEIFYRNDKKLLGRERPIIQAIINYSKIQYYCNQRSLEWLVI